MTTVCHTPVRTRFLPLAGLFGRFGLFGLFGALLAPGGVALADDAVGDEVKLVGSAADYLDNFGYDLDLDGDTLVVGCDEMSFPDFTPGSAYVFVRAAAGWSEQARLQPSDGVSHPPSAFGWGVAVAGDWIVAGSPGWDVTGAAYVFERSGGTWSETQKLLSTTLTFGERFGEETDLHGSRLLVSAPGHISGSLPGQVHVFTENAGAWGAELVLSASDAGNGDRYGIAIDQTGQRIFVGATGHDDANGTNRGAVYVYTQVAGVWVEEVRLEPSTAGDNLAFGSSLAASDERLLIGAAGVVHAYERNAGGWTEVAILQSPNGQANGFGHSIALSGSRAAIGAIHDDTSADDAGRLFLFEERGGTWTSVGDVVSGDIAAGHLYGLATALQGECLVTTAGLAAGASSNFAGAAYAYHWPMPLDATSFCAGDGSSSACPCGNTSATGNDEGCANSGGAGGHLAAFGSASVGADDLSFRATGLPANQASLLFVGTQTVAGGAGQPFGDGLLCVGGSLVRLGVSFADRNGCAAWTVGLGAGGWGAADVRHFQSWYRDPSGGPCGSAFNLTNALELTFLP